MRRTIIIEPSLCKGSECHICVQICPKGVLAKGSIHNKFGGTIPSVVALDECTGCRQCELHCPELCISVEEED